MKQKQDEVKKAQEETPEQPKPITL
jgi:hypothetical protein